MVCDIPVDDIPYGGMKTFNVRFNRRMIQIYLSSPKTMDSSASGLIEEAFEEIGNAIGDRIDHKWWSKILYPIFVLTVISIPVIYYFW
tara:strand:- start:3326 stop:3589 length:264 start_codon:yes stop_codon:yes gene_type:complete